MKEGNRICWLYNDAYKGKIVRTRNGNRLNIKVQWEDKSSSWYEERLLVLLDNGLSLIKRRHNL